MNNVLIAPRRYVQGKNVLAEAGKLFAALGKKPLLVWDAKVRAIIAPTLIPALQSAGLEVVDVEFRGNSTHPEVDRIEAIAREKKADIAVGIGGGKTLDTAKAVAGQAGIKMVTIPTIASNDSPTSSYTVWYDEAGNCMGFSSWGVNPDLVLVDTQVIANAPVRTLIAGMADGMSTWFEADACHKARGANLAGGPGQATLVSLAVARLCFDTIFTYGLDAKRACEQHVVTPALEKVIEANVLMSGLGFESCGCATAHMVANCLPSFPECHHLMHGEEVSFGMVTQFCLDQDMCPKQAVRVTDFMIELGLPVCFEDLKLKGVTRDRLAKIGQICASPGSLCENHPFPVTADMVIDAMIAADALGASRKKALGR